ncbi:MAG TPA: RNA polymerase sigma factor [Gemmatimonadaceae bacterium]|jgi:RNA polymerase sigma-70 factor (ECF subfamily)|nr:RNA polymerase sigma factor [Gemmatimonadaceae bacterium]
MSDVAVAATSPTFESLLYPLLDSAFGVAIRLTGERADAEDLVQEAVLHALRGFGGFTLGTSFKAWFFRILQNAFLTRRRTSRADKQVHLDSAPELTLMESTDGGRRSFGRDPSVLAEFDSDEVAAALRRLPDEHRVVASMYFVDELSYQEIADALGIPVGTVRSRLHRARKTLQSRLFRLAQDHGVIAA